MTQKGSATAYCKDDLMMLACLEQVSGAEGGP